MRRITENFGSDRVLEPSLPGQLRSWSSASMVGVGGHLRHPIDGAVGAPALSRVRFVQLAPSHWLDIDVAFMLAGLR
jgi:hypothetical protein